MQVSDARVLVTGGASGLGRATAEYLAARGARVGIVDLPSSDGSTIAAGFGGVFAAADIRETDDVAAAVGHIAEDLGGLDVCVNAAGVITAHRVITRSGELFPMDLFDFNIRVNVMGTFDVTRRCAAVIAQNEPGDDGERGLIVNVASTAAYEGQIGQAAYSASKGAIAAMTLPLARDLASLGIRVMAIAPGPMETPMLEPAPEDLRASLLAANVFPKRFGSPDEFASLVEHFMTNGFLNGEVVRLDAAARMGPR
jgi:3-hydroxyacyl-CoA dehydrogenase/3-hydroxy-2-methylbutyryl-CoA dehydrogenase